MRTRSEITSTADSSATTADGVMMGDSEGLEDRDDKDQHSPGWWERKFASEAGAGLESAVNEYVPTVETGEGKKPESSKGKVRDGRSRFKRRERDGELSVGKPTSKSKPSTKNGGAEKDKEEGV